MGHYIDTIVPILQALVIRSLLEFYLLFIVATLFNRDLNRGCLVFMFSLRFSRSKFLINYGGNFVYLKFFVHKFLRDLESSHFAFKITNSIVGNSLSRLLSHWRLLINRLLTSAFVLVNRIVLNKSNGLMIKCLITCLMN